MPKEPPAEIMALINTALDAFNRKDPTVFFGDDVVIIDGFAPFRWLGPLAVERWWNDAESWAKAGGVQKEHISLEKIHYGDVSGTRACAVFSATLTITLKEGEPIVRPRILVYTFSRQGDAWKAEGHMRGRLD